MSKTVLVIDDDRGHRDRIRRELESEGYRVLAVAGARAGRDATLRYNVDLVCLMTSLRDDEALAYLDEIVDNLHDTKVVISTSRSDYHLDFRMWAADACLSWSEDLLELKETIKDQLQPAPSIMI